MSEPHLVIIGGGLAGLSAGCHASSSGFQVTILEHNLELGGVCTAWHRGPYTIDGCIHWLTGGAFLPLYEELGIVPAVTLRPITEFVRCRNAREGWETSLGRDLDETERSLRALAPEDADELRTLFEAANHLADVNQNVARPPELANIADRFRDAWRLRHEVGMFVRFRRPIGEWVKANLKSPRLRAVFLQLLPPEAPTLFLLFIFGYLSRGWLSRPVGGTASFRDALIQRYRTLGGKAVLNTTVEEVVVSHGRATGVRLTDGTIIDADVVVSTASAPETVFRLLAGRHGASDWQARMDRWQMFEPIVLASYGVETSLADQPATLLIGGIEPLTIGDRDNDHLYLRIYNDDPSFAPAGHSVIQAMLPTSYNWWATRGAQYQQEKDRTAQQIVSRIDEHVPGVAAAVRMIDMATPLTYWRNTRTWRGAFEGWIPSSHSLEHVPKQLSGLDRFYMAGQWVEPGGGVPMAVMSGRHVVEIICAALDRPFITPVRIRE